MIKITKGNYFLFSGGEVHLQAKPVREVVCLDYTMNGIMAAFCYNEVAKRMCGVSINLTIPYLPYARQDRVMHPYEPFSLKVFCDTLNVQEFKSVTIHDPHSDVAPALINNCTVIPQEALAAQCIPPDILDSPDTVFISPDAGAYKKLSKLVTDDSRIAIGVKKRGIDGKITHTDVFSPVPLAGKTCLIVDDICDGGRTFIALAERLKILGAGRVHLYVTHGIFSHGIEPLTSHIDHIYTTNSFPNISTDFLTITEVV